MNVHEFLATTTAELKGHGISTARLDCLILLEDVLNTNRTQILAHEDRDLTEVEIATLDKLIAERAQHIPLAYIRGKTEFYGREFAINEHVLEPRPESETMIDLLKTLSIEDKPTIIDVGTGSGALAITTALELPDAAVYALDIDANCTALAVQNAAKHSAAVTVLESDLLTNLPSSVAQQPAVYLCNLPYVPDNYQINTAALHEPRLAIFGGADGLDLYRRLFQQLKHGSANNTYVLCESLPLQHAQLTEIAQGAGYSLAEEQDFIQVFKKAA